MEGKDVMKSKLQIKRESLGISIDDLATKSLMYGECGSFGHMILTIKSIEKGELLCSKPRKTYEWACLAEALSCSVDDIYYSFETKIKK